MISLDVRREKELAELLLKRPDLYGALFLFDGLASRMLRPEKPFRIMSIHRTQEENAAIGAISQTHVEWRAVDIGGAEFSQARIDEVARAFNYLVKTNTPKASGGDMVACYADGHGTGRHWHIQAGRDKTLALRGA